MRRELRSLARPVGTFDPGRYFRNSADLRFYNVGTGRMRVIARATARANRDSWSLADALAFAERLIRDPHLEVKGAGIEVLACWSRQFEAPLLGVWKRWLAGNLAANWATTDSICGFLIGPLLFRQPALVAGMRRWVGHSNMWVRRAAAVGVIACARRGIGLDTAYEIARSLHGDREDLVQKAVGWMLREAGKADPQRLERYLRAHGPSIPRTTVRYAIERFPPAKRRALLAATKPGAMMRKNEVRAWAQKRGAPRR